MRTTISIGEDYLKILKDLAKQHDAKSQQDFFHSMITYFQETGINPEAKTRSTADELAKLRNTVVSFIRQQEKTKLDPMVGKLNETFDFLLKYFKEEAVTKSDLKTLFSQKQVNQSYEVPTVNPKKDDEKYKNLTTHVKSLLSEFTKNFKNNTFGSGYTIEKNVFEKYKSMFESL